MVLSDWSTNSATKGVLLARLSSSSLPIGKVEGNTAPLLLQTRPIERMIYSSGDAGQWAV